MRHTLLTDFEGGRVKANLGGTIVLLSILFAAVPAMAGAKEDLLVIDRAFARMSLEKGYDQAYIANLAQDGQTFTGANPIKNKADAVRRFNDPKAPHSDPRIKISWVPDTGGVSADGTLGWTEGHFSRVGPEVSATGHYMTVWVRENGVWKVRADIGSTDPKP
jgi:hypothetical protein